MAHVALILDGFGLVGPRILVVVVSSEALDGWEDLLLIHLPLVSRLLEEGGS